MSLLRQALVQAIASTLDLATDGKSLIWERESFKSESHSGNRYAIHRCVGIAIRPVDGRLYLTINPTFHVPDGLGNGKTDVQAVQKRLLGYQHNSEYNQDLNYWRQKLGQNESEVAYDYPPGTAAFEFTLNTKPAYATISSSGKGISIPTSVERLIRHRGVSVVEPKLLFAPTAGWQPSSDTMPLRGLANNGPYDLALSTSPLGERLRLSVVCPKAESGLLENFLNGINGQWHPKGNTGEYLVPYPGFANALRIPIDIPKRSDVRWFTLPEIAPSCDDRTGALSLSRNICDAIQAASASSRSIVVILTPERWERWRHFESDDETFDVHNFVKAFAVQRGISTQFLTQEKLSVEDKCRFWWWFAVALYAKAMRTPWVLEGLDSNTAFVGLGYAIDSMARSGGKIVLGCSHLYNALGQGLQFRLSRIENPIIRGRNPYLSFDDARRMGETIRALYWEAHQRLPDRVVIHKLFPFRAEESKGLLRGLEGVDILDLVEINHESKLRYLSSRPTKGGFQDDRFPVRRGTLVRLSDFEALGWVHGATDAIRTNWTYFQGKRRIPGPVIIRRHAGSSTLSTLFNEILGLSKMDWNSGDLYSQLPATVQSSKAIAQIGSLLERFGKESYDYRLFM